MHLTLLTLSLALAAAQAAEPKVEVLWPKGAPARSGSEDVDKPTLTVYLPPADKANGTAVVVCPGGGYGNLAVDHEGKELAEWLNRQGVAAFVLKYRLAPRYRHPAPLQDAQRAIRTVRAGPRSGTSTPTASASGASRRAAIWPRPPARTSTTASPTRPTRSSASAAGPIS